MREFKFRAWDKKLNIMINRGFNIKSLFIYTPCCMGCLYHEDSVISCGFEDKEIENKYFIKDNHNYHQDIRDDNIILMQFTGLKDKNGKEIYEGDIYINRNKNTHIVKYNDFEGECGSICKGYEFESGYIEYIEVIGNIYENPEMIIQ